MLSIRQSALPNLFLNLGAFWIPFGAIWINLKTLSVKWRSHCLGLNVLTYCGQFLVVSIWQSTLLKQNSFYFADESLIYNFEFVLILHMQLSYLKINLKSSSAKYRPYCPCLDVLTHCGRDKVTSILKTTFFIFISNFRWNLNKIYILEMAIMFRQLCFERETKWCPFQDDIYFKLIFLYGIDLLFFSNLTSVRF